MNVFGVISKFTRTSRLLARKRPQVYSVVQRFTNDDTTNTKRVEEQTDEQYEDTIKQKILNASLPFVNELGWTQDALTKGAESIGYPGIIHGIFPRGGAELVHHFYKECNLSLAQKLKKDSMENPDVIPLKFIQGAVQTRILMIVPYKSKWPQAIAIMALPPNVTITLASLLTLVDDICYFAGDRSVDLKWYSRRLALGCIYKATELYFIQDKSENQIETWNYLNKNLEGLFQIQDILNSTENFSTTATETLSSAFATARHMLGINWNRKY